MEYLFLIAQDLTRQVPHLAQAIMQQYGYLGLFIVTIFEQFLLPIPSEVLVAIGITARLPLKNLLLVVIVGAFIGSYIGYFLGKFLGHPIATWLFGKKIIDKGEYFIRKYGVWGLIIGAFTPAPYKIMTWTAGIFEMPLGRFTLGIIFGQIPRYILTASLAAFAFKTKFYASAEMSAVILGAFQGITEFLPISSSGHLVIMENFLKLPPHIRKEHLEIFDIFLHGGSLLAILLYFRKDWADVVKAFIRMIFRRTFDKNTLAAKLIIGTIPAVIVGLFLGDVISSDFRQLNWIAFFFILTSLYYLYAEWKRKNSAHDTVSSNKAAVIGVAQALALFPGLSRSGSTIATGMILGIKRQAATRFSFMLGGVAIFAANVYAFFARYQADILPDRTFTFLGVITSFIVSFFTIHWLLKFFQKHTLLPFAFYLMIVGGFILSLP